MADKKKVVVLDHGGGRLANQLWTDAAICAYAVERGYEFESWASFEYHKYFDIPPIRNWFVRAAFFNPLVAETKNPLWRRWIARKLIKKILYKFLSAIIKRANAKMTIEPGKNNFFFPSSRFSTKEDTERLSAMEKSVARNIYFYGYGFRNPDGLKKYRNEVISHFALKQIFSEKPEALIQKLRSRFKYVVGVHFRQGDYRTVPSHHIWRYTNEEVRAFLDSYLFWSGKKIEDVVFLISSDERIGTDKFKGLNIEISNGDEIEDLHSLSLTDLVIGSKSTYGDFAAYYGNIPFVVFERNGIEWDYYGDKKEYFENKKSHLNSELPIDRA